MDERPRCIGCNRQPATPGSEFCGNCLLGFRWDILEAVSREVALTKAGDARVIAGPGVGQTVRLIWVGSGVSRIVPVGRGDHEYEYLENMNLEPLL